MSTPTAFLLGHGNRRGWDGDKSTTTNGMGGVERGWNGAFYGALEEYEEHHFNVMTSVSFHLLLDCLDYRLRCDIHEHLCVK